MDQPTYCLTPFMVNQVAKIAECLGVLEARARTGSSKQSPASAGICALQMITGNTLLWELIAASRNNNPANKARCKPLKIHNVAQAYPELESYSPYEVHDLLQAHRLLMVDVVPHPGRFRTKSLRNPRDKQAVGVAPEPEEIPGRVEELLRRLQNTDEHPLIAGCMLCFQFEYLRPFDEGNDRMAILWESLLLFRWSPFFLELPIEAMVHDHRQEYHAILDQPATVASATRFIEFMLERISDSCDAVFKLRNDQDNNQDRDQVYDQNSDPDSDQVKSICTLLKTGPLSASKLMQKLKLSHRANFRKHYLNPALDSGLVERTIPNKPTSRSQKYRLIRQ